MVQNTKEIQRVSALAKCRDVSRREGRHAEADEVNATIKNLADAAGEQSPSVGPAVLTIDATNVKNVSLLRVSNKPIQPVHLLCNDAGMGNGTDHAKPSQDDIRNAFLVLAVAFSKPISEIREAVEALPPAKAETIGQLADIAEQQEGPSVAPASAAGAALSWPSKRWNKSSEKIRGKKNGIVTFLMREWEPFIQDTGKVVTREILADHDFEAAEALKRYLERHDMPMGISIVYPQQLARLAKARPEVVRKVLGLFPIPDAR